MTNSHPTPTNLSLKLATMAVVLAASLIGCATNYHSPAIVNTKVPKAETWVKNKWYNVFGSDGPRARGEFINPYTYNPMALSFKKSDGTLTNRQDSLYAKANSTNTPAEKKLARNQLQNAIIRLSDNATGRHLAGLKATENGANLLLGGAAIGLSSGATVAATETAKLLSAAAASAGGLRGLVNEQLYRNALGETIVRAVETDRSQFLATIITPNQQRPVEEYDMEAAIRDANEYHQRGSFYHGLALIREAAEKANSEAKEKGEQKREADAQFINLGEIEIMKVLAEQGVGTNAVQRFSHWRDTMIASKVLSTNAPSELGPFIKSDEFRRAHIGPLSTILRADQTKSTQP